MSAKVDVGDAQPPARLSVDKLHKAFGGLRALDNVSIAFPSSGTVALIGPNGAGKSTLFNVICGYTRPDAGECRLAGRVTTRMRPSAIANLGVARTFQSVRLVRELSVLENACLARPRQRGEQFFAALTGLQRSEEAGGRTVALDLLDRFGLKSFAAVPAGHLSYGQQKLLSLACCFAMDAEILLLDEPIAGVHPDMASIILAAIADAAGAGKLVVFIEHDIEAVAHHSDESIILHHGKVLARGAPSDVLSLPDVIEAYVG